MSSDNKPKGALDRRLFAVDRYPFLFVRACYQVVNLQRKAVSACREKKAAGRLCRVLRTG